MKSSNVGAKSCASRCCARPIRNSQPSVRRRENGLPAHDAEQLWNHRLNRGARAERYVFANTFPVDELTYFAGPVGTNHVGAIIVIGYVLFNGPAFVRDSNEVSEGLL